MLGLRGTDKVNIASDDCVAALLGFTFGRTHYEPLLFICDRRRLLVCSGAFSKHDGLLPGGGLVPDVSYRGGPDSQTASARAAHLEPFQLS